MAPFFFLNHKLEKKTLQRHIANMATAGFDGFFLHAREGLRTPYLSEEWFDAIETCLASAEQHKLKAWLYDEMPYPSGAAGGEVVRHHPEFIEQSLRIVSDRVSGPVDLDWEIGDDEVIAAFAKLVGNNKKRVIDLLPHIGPVADTWLKVHWDSRWYYPPGLAEIFSCPRTTCVLPRNVITARLGPGDWELVAVCLIRGGEHVESFGQYVDVSNSEATEEFLRLTHEQYRRRFGKKFGTLIPGIFFDEPKFRSATPWGRGVAKILGKISPELAFALAGKHSPLTSQELSRYRLAADAAFKKNWLQPVRKWCAQNNLQLTGHISPEEDWWFESRQTGSILKSLRQLDIPGCDLIIPAVGDLRNPVLNITASLAVSAAAQTGKKHALCEVFACSGHYLPIPQLRKISTWLACHGINFLVPHGWFYSRDAFRKYDAPPDFAPPNYDIAELRQWAEDFRRIATGPVPQADLLIVRPIDYLRSLPEDSKPQADRLLADAAHLVTRLFLTGWSWHWIDDDEIDQCVFKDHGIKFMRCRYNTLVYFEDFLTPKAKKILSAHIRNSSVIPASKAAQKFPPRHQAQGEVFLRISRKNYWFFNLGATTGRISVRGLHRTLLPGEWLGLSTNSDGELREPQQIPRKNYHVSDWRFFWPEICFFRPQKWFHRKGEVAKFGCYFDTGAPLKFSTAQTVFGPVPNQHEDVTPFTKLYSTTFTSEKILNLRLVVEGGALRGEWSATLNGKPLRDWASVQDHRLAHDIAPLLKNGVNHLTFAIKIKKLSHGLMEPPWLEGRFGIRADGKMVNPANFSERFDEQFLSALPEFAEPLCWRCTLQISEKNLNGVKIRLKRPAQDAVAVTVNGIRATSIQGPPWRVDIGQYLREGPNEIFFQCHSVGRLGCPVKKPEFLLCR